MDTMSCGVPIEAPRQKSRRIPGQMQQLMIGDLNSALSGQMNGQILPMGTVSVFRMNAGKFGDPQGAVCIPDGGLGMGPAQ